MKHMNKNELIEINGGGFSFGLSIIIGGIATFLIGIFDGLIRPLACNAK